jgi:hypothetical protein
MDFLNGCAYLKEAEFVWGIWGPYDDGLHISDIHIPTCNSNSFSVACMSVRVLSSEGYIICVGIFTEIVALLDAAQLLNWIVSLATPASKQGDVQTLVILMIEWFDMVFRRITDQTVIRDACGACEDSCEEGDERRERVMLLRRSGSEWEALRR